MYQYLQNDPRNPIHGFPHHLQTWNPPQFPHTVHNFQPNPPSVPLPHKRSRDVYKPGTSTSTPRKIQSRQRFSYVQQQQNHGLQSNNPNVIPNNYNQCSYQGNNQQFYPSELGFFSIPSAIGSVSTVSPASNTNLDFLLSVLNENPPTETPVVQDSMRLEFDPVKLKVRHESVISSLYRDLPIQCRTCGNRFRTQEEHSKLMLSHVNKNCMAKKLKKKIVPRGWYKTEDMWLVETKAMEMVETKDADDYEVVADEDQKVCALCYEAFDEYYSDEVEDWMYKGAVYLNAPHGSTQGMEKSQLGPIIHIKCGPGPAKFPSLNNCR